MNQQQPETAPGQDFPNFNPAPAPRFEHPRNIEFGQGRVIFVERPTDGGPPGWALPGQEITREREVAMAVAFRIDRISNDNAHITSWRAQT